MKFILNICLFLYKPNEIELNNYLFAFEKINKIINNIYPEEKNNLISFSIASDNPNLEDDQNILNLLNKFKKIDNFEYFKSEKNLKKTNLTIKIADKINAKFLKICDPDDIVIPKNIIKIAKEIKNLTDNSIIIYKFKRIINNNRIIIKNFDDFEKIEKIKTRDYFEPIPYNGNTIYSIALFKKLKEENWLFEHTVWGDDMTIIAIQKYKPNYVYFPSHMPYINIRNNGISITKNKHTNNEFYEASIDMIKIIKKNYKYLDRDLILFKPCFFLIKTVQNNLVLYKKNKIVKLYKFLYFLFLIKININKNKYNFWYRNKREVKYFWKEIGCIFLLIFNIRI